MGKNNKGSVINTNCDECHNKPTCKNAAIGVTEEWKREENCWEPTHSQRKGLGRHKDGDSRQY